MHYYAYKNYALFLAGFFLLVTLWGWLCYLPYCQQKNECCLAKELKVKVYDASKALDECCNCNTLADVKENKINELRRDYGGSIGEVTITLAWQTTDDLDLHILEPSGELLNFENKIVSSGGRLDIDKNAGEILINEPIENIYYPSKPPRGKYGIFVHYFGSKSGAVRIPYRVFINIGGVQKQISGAHYSEGDMHAVYEFLIP